MLLGVTEALVGAIGHQWRPQRGAHGPAHRASAVGIDLPY